VWGISTGSVHRIMLLLVWLKTLPARTLLHLREHKRVLLMQVFLVFPDVLRPQQSCCKQPASRRSTAARGGSQGLQHHAGTCCPPPLSSAYLSGFLTGTSLMRLVCQPPPQVCLLITSNSTDIICSTDPSAQLPGWKTRSTTLLQDLRTWGW